MVNREFTSADNQSIFGDTYRGVPSPKIPHTHPYPTRFHGPIYTIPRFMKPYRQQSWQVPGNLIGPSSYVGPVSGFGSDNGPALFGTATGSIFIDCILGGALGYAMARTKSEQVTWAGAGAAAGLLAGTLGLLGIVGAAVYVRR